MGDASWEEASKQPGLRSLCVHTSGKAGASYRVPALSEAIPHVSAQHAAVDSALLCSSLSILKGVPAPLSQPGVKATYPYAFLTLVPAWTQDRVPHGDAENM